MGVKYFRDVALVKPAEMWAAAKHSEVQFVDGDYGGDCGSAKARPDRTDGACGRLGTGCGFSGKN